jgi:hypothetical protein
MLRETISTRTHCHGEVVADVYRRRDAAGQEVFSYTFSGRSVGESATFWNVPSPSKEQAQNHADGRVTEEYRLRGIDHQCSPDECSQWNDIAGRTSLQRPAAPSSLAPAGATVANRQAQEAVRDDAEVVRQDAEQTRDVTEARRYRRRPPEPRRTTVERLLKGRVNFMSSSDRNWRR